MAFPFAANIRTLCKYIVYTAGKHAAIRNFESVAVERDIPRAKRKKTKWKKNE